MDSMSQAEPKTISFLDGYYLKYMGFEKIQGLQPKTKR